MRRVKRNWGLWTLSAAALGVCGLVGVASASSTDISTERSGSMIVFPKVIADGTTDTVIQITNTGNPTVLARCFYINAAVPGQCNETDFEIFLTRQQPTEWVVSTGRSSRDLSDGFPPGLVPAIGGSAGNPFAGELKCIQVDDSGAPLPTNVLIGQATLVHGNGDVSGYSAIAFQGNPQASTPIGDDISLNLTQNSNGSLSGEFSPCPDTLIVNHFADGVVEPVIDELQPGFCAGTPNTCPISTDLTLVPCQEDLENQVPGSVTMQFEVRDEFEVPYSFSTTVTCWLDVSLGKLSGVLKSTSFGSAAAQMRITGAGGVIGVAEENRSGAWAAFNLATEGTQSGVDHVVLPAQ